MAGTTADQRIKGGKSVFRIQAKLPETLHPAAMFFGCDNPGIRPIAPVHHLDRQSEAARLFQSEAVGEGACGGIVSLPWHPRKGLKRGKDKPEFTHVAAENSDHVIQRIELGRQRRIHARPIHSGQSTVCQGNRGMDDTIDPSEPREDLGTGRRQGGHIPGVSLKIERPRSQRGKPFEMA
ncbi:hypothetical protein RvVAR0630_43420 [Agrobacterium vitis]|nr:hypothetical protein RvVAR0630_43420 [Agrobacterium vitis]